ncbi:hypothetical protein EC902281_0779, partial [Escherichia coli 90.2281]
MTWPFRSS